MSKRAEKHIQRTQSLGVRVTPQRQLILETLGQASEPQSAYALQAQLAQQGHAFNISTIYRVLEFWIEQSVVHKLMSANTFLLCNDTHMDHVHLLQRCSRCGEVKEQCAASMRFEFPKTQGFLPDQAQVIEVVGQCASCKM